MFVSRFPARIADTIWLALFVNIVLSGLSHSAFVDQFPTGSHQVEVSEFVVVPNRSDGNAAKLNAITFTSGRLYAVESHDGLIYDITDGQVSVWFDIRNALQGAFNNSDNVEGGLRSVAFHPNFSENGKFYTSQDQNRPANSTSVTYLSDVARPQPTDSVVTEWTRLSNGSFSGPRELIRIGQPGIHSIKQIMFNPSATVGAADYGLLYVAHGDGGSVESNFSDHRNSGLGKILRIDPLPSVHSAYTVPVNNPFVGDPSVPDEVYALGFRNPHNFSFTADGTLISADIGSGNVEEINFVESGADYGWGAREGAFQFLNSTRESGITSLPADDARHGFSYPVASFRHDPQHNGGLAVAGGYAIENQSALHGLYIFAEFGSTGELLYSTLSDLRASVTSGSPANLKEAEVYQADVIYDHDDNATTPSHNLGSMLEVINFSVTGNNVSSRADLRFGQGRAGEIYISSKQNNTIYRVTNSVSEDRSISGVVQIPGSSSTPLIQSSENECIDEDGDGWGWNGTATCQPHSDAAISQIGAQVEQESDTLPCVDTDGDGWGWDGSASCMVEQGATEMPSTGSCVDTDGDGWGWNGSATCVVSSTAAELLPTNSCIDTDGDGWGWNGVSSCVVGN